MNTFDTPPRHIIILAHFNVVVTATATKHVTFDVQVSIELDPKRTAVLVLAEVSARVVLADDLWRLPRRDVVDVPLLAPH